jgi:hypothetical protein
LASRGTSGCPWADVKLNVLAEQCEAHPAGARVQGAKGASVPPAVVPRISQMIASERDATVRFDYVSQGFGEHGGGGGWMTRRVKREGAGCGSRSTAG